MNRPLAAAACLMLIAIPSIALQPGTPPATAASKPDEPKIADEPAANDPRRAGPMHAWLAKAEGNWSGDARSLKDGKYIEWKSRMDIGVRLNGRFLICDSTGRYEGRFITGHAMLGFNNETGKFERSWCESEGTAMYMFTGTLDKDQRVLTMTTDPAAATAAAPARRWVFSMLGKDSLKEEHYLTRPGPDGKMVEVLHTEITYARGTLSESTLEKRELKKN